MRILTVKTNVKTEEGYRLKVWYLFGIPAWQKVLEK